MKKFSTKILVFILILMIVFTAVSCFFVTNESYALSSTYTQYVKSGINAFPESYRKKLAYLKYLHPNWEFKAYYTGISWNEVTSTSAENMEMKNTIYKGTNLDLTALCRCGRQGDPGYYDASNLMVRFYLDPRNMLGEAMVFQFLDLANSEGVTIETVNSAVKGTYLEPYAGVIMETANETGISPLHIVATIFQELGRSGNPRAISGTVSGYEGLYNFYNYGATDGSGAVERGLAKARELGWTSPEFAIKDGAKRVLADGYISAGQTTKYFYKFDVVGNEILTESMGSKTYSSSYFYSHQYMTNLMDPSSQAGSLYDIYADNLILESNLTFVIPVYDNMPDVVSMPTSLTSDDGELYYIDTMKRYGINFRSGASSSSAAQGNIYKDTIVAVTGTSGSWSQIKINAVTSYDSSTKTWNYEQKTGYVASEYLTKVGSVIPDYTGEVDMGGESPSPSPSVSTSPSISPSVSPSTSPSVDPVGSSDLRFDGTYLYTSPSVTAEDIVKLNSGAVVKNSGNVVSGSQMVATGYNVTVGGKNYLIIKKADVSLDGKLDAMDMYQIIQHLNGNSNLSENSIKAADVNSDGKIDAMDMYQITQYLLGNLKFKI